MSQIEPTPGVSKRAAQWIVGPWGEVGLSAKTIWSVMMDVDTAHHDIPHDPGDFGRCHRLLELIPEWRDRLGAVAARYAKWGPLVEHWGELTELYLAWQESKSDADWEAMYQRMGELEELAFEAAGWVRHKGGWSKGPV